MGCGFTGRRQLVNNFILSCSGASDVGEIADRVARVLGRNGLARTICLSAVAARKPDVLEQLRHADRILVIDGCDIGCARKILSEAGIDRPVEQLRLSELGYEKGKTPPSVPRIAAAVGVGSSCLARDPEAHDDAL